MSCRISHGFKPKSLSSDAASYPRFEYFGPPILMPCLKALNFVCF